MKYTFNNEHWKEIVAHVWSSAYLLKNYGAYFRKFTKVLSKALIKSFSDWTGMNVWQPPIVSLAPPCSFYNSPTLAINIIKTYKVPTWNLIKNPI